MGLGLEKSRSRELPQDDEHRDARRGHELSRQLCRSGSQLYRCLRTAAASHDVRLWRKRTSAVGLFDGSRHRCRQAHGGAGIFGEPAHRLLFDRSLSDNPQYGRRDHGIKPKKQRGEPLSAELGCAKSLCLGCIGVSTECGVQSDGDRCGSHLLVGGRHHNPISQVARPAGRSMKRAVLLGLVMAGTLAGSSVFPQAPLSSNANPIAARGAYLVTLGDCMPCHTAAGQEQFAGARALNTPFGVVYSANITPERETGIGNWTSDQFYRALHKGIRADGAHLYPALPYPYFTRMSRADSDALYAYLMTLKPVHKVTPSNKLPFPFNVRALIGVWNAMNFKEGEFQQDATKSAEWNRGAYIVTGPGHCGGCHTPKNFLGGDEKIGRA